MEEYRKFCSTCGEEKDIIEIKCDATGGIIKLSCGHAHIYDTIIEHIKVNNSYGDEIKDRQRKLISKSKRKRDDIKSGKNKQHIYTFDHVKRIRYHEVKEQDKDGKWTTIFGPEPRPFAEKKNKTKS